MTESTITIPTKQYQQMCELISSQKKYICTLDEGIGIRDNIIDTMRITINLCIKIRGRLLINRTLGNL